MPSFQCQVLKGLDQARNTQLRALCVRVRKALAESVWNPGRTFRVGTAHAEPKEESGS